NYEPGRFSRLWNMVKERSAVTIESTHRTKDGKTFPVEIRANFVTFQGSEYCFAIAHDITERKEAEARERRAAERLRRLQETLVQLATARELWDTGTLPAVQKIDEEVAKALDVERAGVWLLESGDTTLRALDVYAAGEHLSGMTFGL